MNEPDKPFHDWVRQSLNDYRPAYEPADWQALQRTLRQKRWRFRGFMLGLAALFIGLTGWFLQYNRPATTAEHSKKTTLPATDKLAAKPASPGTTQPAQPTMKPPVQPAQIQAIRRTGPIGKVAKPSNESVSLLPSASSLLFPTRLTSQLAVRQAIVPSLEEAVIVQQMRTGAFGSDSTSYRVLERNLQKWPDAVLVCDLTTSMYPYSTQLFAWFRKHARNRSVQGLVFFTDCDSLGRQTYPGGPAGQMFITKDRDPADALPTLVAAARNTAHNDDGAENDVEALLAAQRTFPTAKHLILLADNASAVKDMPRLDSLHKPVHVVLCGTTGLDTLHAFQRDYYTIARQTHGTLHTLTDDIDPAMLSAATTLRSGIRYYRYVPRRQQFKLTPFRHRPRRFLKFIWL